MHPSLPPLPPLVRHHLADNLLQTLSLRFVCSAIKELARLQATVKDAAKLEAKSARARDETTKVEQKAKARLLEVKAVHDKAEAELRAKEEEHAVRLPFLHPFPHTLLAEC